MMNAVIIEDNEYIRKALISLLQSEKTNINVVAECEGVKESVVVVNACKPDLIFLDIKLSDGTAFDFLDVTKNLNYKVIFITAYEEYALQALKVGAVDYLLKPVDVDELKIALKKVSKLSLTDQKQQITKVQQAYNNDSDTLILSLKDSFQIIHIDNLMFCESDKGYTTFFLDNEKKYIASKPIKEFEKQLSKHNFTQPHQSFFINLKFIDRYDKSGTIYLTNGYKIPVSSRKKKDFISTLLNWNRL